MSKKTKKQKLQRPKIKKLDLMIEELEERIAPSMAPGLLGYEGQPGNQGGGGGLGGYEGQPGNQGGPNHHP